MTAAGASDLPPWVFLAPFILFPLFWIAILGFIAMMGWRELADAYPASSEPPPSARSIAWGSMSIGRFPMRPNYGSCINAWLSGTGLWLRPSLPFRPFHPMIYVPWSQVRSVEKRRVLFLLSKVRVSLAGEVPDLWLLGRLGRAVLEQVGERKGSRS